MRLTTAARASLRPEDAGWIAIGGKVALDPARRISNIEIELTSALDAVSQDWLALGHLLSQELSAELAHAPCCAGNVSDLGLMLAWSRLVAGWAASDRQFVVVSDDPWLSRHLARLPGVRADDLPSLWLRSLLLSLRGAAARIKVAVQASCNAIAFASDRTRHPRGCHAILVYGHPASTADGNDGYFGSMLRLIPSAVRLLHVDSPHMRARQLGLHARTASLHGWGPWWSTWRLLFARWRPTDSQCSGEYGWLIRRAAAQEGSGAQGAIIRWQQICHSAWLKSAAPRAVAWPWENHGWERDFVRRARQLGVRTIGYQHATVGRQELNYAPASNRDQDTSLPDLILVAGRESRNTLIRIGHDPDRTAIGGTFRIAPPATGSYDPMGPIFVALPSDHEIAAEIVAAIRPIGREGRRFLIKAHPMNPLAFNPSAGLESTDLPLGSQQKLSAVLYSATTVGLEALLNGLPTLEFLPSSKVALDIMPQGTPVRRVTAASLPDALSHLKPPAKLDPESIFSPPDLEIWRREFQPTG